MDVAMSKVLLTLIYANPCFTHPLLLLQPFADHAMLDQEILPSNLIGAWRREFSMRRVTHQADATHLTGFCDTPTHSTYSITNTFIIYF